MDVVDITKELFSNIEESIQVVRTCRDDIEGRTEALSHRTARLAREQSLIKQTLDSMKDRIANVQASETVSARLKSSKWTELLACQQKQKLLFVNTKHSNSSTNVSLVGPSNNRNIVKSTFVSPFLSAVTLARDNEGRFVFTDPPEIDTSLLLNCELNQMLTRLDSSVAFLKEHWDSFGAHKYLIDSEGLRNSILLSITRLLQSNLSLAEQQAKSAANGLFDSVTGEKIPPARRMQMVHDRILTTLEPLRPATIVVCSRLTEARRKKDNTAETLYDTALEKMENLYLGCRFKLVAELLKENIGSFLEIYRGATCFKACIEITLHACRLELLAFRDFFLESARSSEDTIKKGINFLMQICYSTLLNRLNQQSTSIAAADAGANPTSANARDPGLSLSELREIADFLSFDILEPAGLIKTVSTPSTSTPVLPPPPSSSQLILLSSLSRLHKDVQTKLLTSAQTLIHRRLTSKYIPPAIEFSKGIYPWCLLPSGVSLPSELRFAPSPFPAKILPTCWQPHQGVCNAMEVTSSVLAQVFGVIEPIAFQSLAVDVIIQTIKALQATGMSVGSSPPAHAVVMSPSSTSHTAETVNRNLLAHAPWLHQCLFEIKHLLLLRRSISVIDVDLVRANVRLDILNATRSLWSMLRGDEGSRLGFLNSATMMTTTIRDSLSSFFSNRINNSSSHQQLEDNNTNEEEDGRRLLENTLKKTCERFVAELSSALLSPLVKISSFSSDILKKRAPQLNLPTAATPQELSANSPSSSSVTPPVLMTSPREPISPEMITLIRQHIDEFCELISSQIPQVLFLCRLYVEPDTCAPIGIPFATSASTPSLAAPPSISHHHNSRYADNMHDTSANSNLLGTSVSTSEAGPSNIAVSFNSANQSNNMSQQVNAGPLEKADDDDLAGSVFGGRSSIMNSVRNGMAGKTKKSGGVLWLFKPVSVTVMESIRQVSRVLHVDLFLTEEDLESIGWKRVENTTSMLVAVIDSIRTIRCHLVQQQQQSQQ